MFSSVFSLRLALCEQYPAVHSPSERGADCNCEVIIESSDSDFFLFSYSGPKCHTFTTEVIYIQVLHDGKNQSNCYTLKNKRKIVQWPPSSEGAKAMQG